MTSFDRNMLTAGLVIVPAILALAARIPEQQACAVTASPAVCRADAVAQSLAVTVVTAAAPQVLRRPWLGW
jgi:hypothetical protein